jgi:cell division protein FtsI/penicillin-binding protein 2
MTRGIAAATCGGAERCDSVAKLTVWGITLLLLIMLGRVAQLQLAPSAALAAHMQERVTKRAVPAPRGDIVDRAGRFLATSEFGYRVFVDPLEFPDPPDEAISRLAEVLGDQSGEMGEKIVSRMMINQERLGDAGKPVELAAPATSSEVVKRLTSLLQTGSRSVAPAAQGPDGAQLKPIRYVRISDVISDETVARVRALKISGVHLEQRSVREYPSGALAASIIGKVGVEDNGLLGAERSHDGNLTGQSGKVLYVRDAAGRPLWMGPASFELPRSGENLRLSLDLELQRIAIEELQRGVEEFDAAGGRLVMMDPATGEILAMVDIVRPVPDAIPFPWPDAKPKQEPGAHRPRALLYEPPLTIPRARYQVIKPDPGRLVHPALARNRCVEDIYEPGSTFKSFTWATITELGKFRLGDVLRTGNGYWRTPYGRPIRDVHGKEQQTWADVLVNSSNIGLSQGAEKLTFDQMSSAIRRFGFGTRTGIGLPGESPGKVTPRKSWSKFSQTSVSFGQEVAVTPVQMARAFCAFARAGEMGGTLPRARLTALDDDDPERYLAVRVVRKDVAAIVRELLSHVAADMEYKMVVLSKDTTVWRYAIFGKSGTAQIPIGAAPAGKRRPGRLGYYERQYNASFIAGGPTENPRLVVLAVIDDPGPELVRKNRYYGSLTAGPVVRRVMERSLAYLSVPPSPASSFVKPPSTDGSGAD